MATEEERCPLCGKTREEHAALEAARILNHQFSSDGDLHQTDSKPTAKQREVMVLPGADLLLRQLLISKGVLSETDFRDAGAIGYGPEGDTRPRPVSGTE